MAEILDEKIPSIKEKNNHVRSSLNNRYPHLQGYFNNNSIGLIDRNKTLDIAQKKFFHAQKEILDATDLTEATYNKSLDVSARLLTEYVLYRNIIINKLKTIDISHSENEIHNFIVPTKKIFRKDNFIKDIYSNNVWLLDDKYMSYRTILSELQMSKLLKELEINGENSDSDDTRPDISLIFSNDPNATDATENKVDVVIVELKKLGLKLAKREEVVSQLKQRARKLLNYFPNKIQRIWFYGIVDIDKEFRISLKEDGYTELYSKGELFYNEEKIIIDEDKDLKIPIGVYIMSFDAFLKDAETRNSTFLEILKEGLKRKIQDENISTTNGLSFDMINSYN